MSVPTYRALVRRSARNSNSVWPTHESRVRAIGTSRTELALAGRICPWLSSEGACRTENWQTCTTAPITRGTGEAVEISQT